jgi:hypothetical protein
LNETVFTDQGDEQYESILPPREIEGVQSTPSATDFSHRAGQKGFHGEKLSPEHLVHRWYCTVSPLNNLQNLTTVAFFVFEWYGSSSSTILTSFLLIYLWINIQFDERSREREV